MPIEFEYTGDDDIEEDSEKEEMQEVLEWKKEEEAKQIRENKKEGFRKKASSASILGSAILR